MLLSGIVAIGIFMYGCSNENAIPVSIDNETVNSVELEEYIITASDFKGRHARNISHDLLSKSLSHLLNGFL
jgi:hypothetical protein